MKKGELYKVVTTDFYVVTDADPREWSHGVPSIMLAVGEILLVLEVNEYTNPAGGTRKLFHYPTFLWREQIVSRPIPWYRLTDDYSEGPWLERVAP